MSGFQHYKLDVYGMAVSFVESAVAIAGEIPRHRRFLADQSMRAATSVSLNICEGAAEFSPSEKARFYRMARRSAAECAGCLDVRVAMDLLSEANAEQHRRLLGNIAGKLTRMVDAVESRIQPSRPRPHSPKA